MARKVNHTERRQEVALKALHLFSKVGYENVTLIMVAEATGISRTVLYRYFDSKRDVMDAAIATVLDEIETASVQIVRVEKYVLKKASKQTSSAQMAELALSAERVSALDGGIGSFHPRFFLLLRLDWERATQS